MDGCLLRFVAMNQSALRRSTAVADSVPDQHDSSARFDLQTCTLIRRQQTKCPAEFLCNARKDQLLRMGDRDLFESQICTVHLLLTPARRVPKRLTLRAFASGDNGHPTH